MSDSGGDASTRDEGVAADDETADGSTDGPSTQPAAPSAEDVDVPPRQPSAASSRDSSVPDPTRRPLRWYLRSKRPLVIASRDILSSVLIVAVLGVALFAVSGVWPPLVAVESGSMEPNMEQGDLVLVVEEDRFASQLADEHGIVTREAAIGSEHRQFGKPGSVIVFKPDGDDGTPIIHRAALWVDQGDRWVERADPAHLGNVDECSEIQSCPAPHDGYITRGDANANYDQIDGQSTVVKPAWIRGRAVSRTPYLGCIRLALSEGGICGA